jgi:hypothetical protein
MTSKLVGEYHFTNSTLLKQGTPPTKLILSQRSEETPVKSKFFVLEVLPTGGRRYISSLYEAPNWSKNGLRAYSFDFGGVDYLLTLDRDHQKGVILETSKGLKGGVLRQNP